MRLFRNLVMQKQKGSATLMMAIMAVLIASILSGRLFLYEVKRYREKQAQEVVGEIQQIINATNTHYTHFILAAGKYLDEYDSTSPASKNPLHVLWAKNDTDFSVPAYEESPSQYYDRLEISDRINGMPSDIKSVQSVKFKTIITAYTYRPIGCTDIPAKWKVLITFKSNGAGEFDESRLRFLIAQNPEFIANIHKKTNITASIVTCTRSKVVIMLEYGIVDYGGYQDGLFI